ncbi:MAG: metalloregulator ArsR/SmtB family transcription factor [Thermoproteota archaeon]|jgi:DNA-binding transcriptional ArsR family regulator|nr:metalloregulator ArsR/SmtB family transcription factor [Thermoproteota archaeon]
MEIDKEKAYKLFFKAISNPTRLKIINVLRNGPKTVTEIVNETGFEQSRVSHNLKCLLDCGFIENKRKGKYVIYSLNKDTILPLLDLMDKHISLYAEYLIKCNILKTSKK